MNKILKLIIFIILAILVINIATYILKVVFNYRTLSITNFDINALVKENGDITVDLLNEYKFNGKYNGIYIILPKNINSYNSYYKSINDSSLSDTLYNNSDIKDFKVYLVENGIDIELKEVNHAKLGDKYVYTKEYNNGYEKYMIYEPSYDESKTFKISYTLVNAAVKHLDSAEVYWNFIGGNYECNIDKLNIDLTFESPSQIKHAYIHGNQTGKLSINDYTVNSQYRNVSAKQFVALRVLFDNTSIVNSNKHSYTQAIPIILEQEKVIQTRTEKRILINNILIYLTILLCIYYIYLLVKYEYDKLFIMYCDDEYELLNKYNPMILACIAQNREMNARDIIAVLLDLVNKKVLTMEVKNNVVKQSYVLKKSHENYSKKLYILTKTNNNIKIDDIEQSILDMFFSDKERIILEFKIKEINKNINTIYMIKNIDKLAIDKLSEIGANSKKVSKSLLTFNNIIFGIVCIVILFSIAFNISLETSTLSQTNSDFSRSNSIMLARMIITTFVFLPIILYIIYFLLYLLKNTQKYIGRLAFKFSGKRLFIEITKFVTISSMVFIILLLTVKNEYIIIDTALFMVSLLIIMTDNLMSRHDVKIYKTFLNLKMIQNKIENGSLLKEKSIADVLLWEKYLTFAVALGVTDVSKYTNGLDIKDNLNDFLLQTNNFTSNFYNINVFERDFITDMHLIRFKEGISSLSESFLYSAGHSSSFGGGGFSGGGGGGGRWWWILIYPLWFFVFKILKAADYIYTLLLLILFFSTFNEL